MADYRKRVPENVPGEFFVDSTCIDCDTCRQLAPQVFAEAAEYAYVHRQPRDGEDARAALGALVCCPTGSIGSRGGADPKKAFADFPQEIEAPVYYCGFNSPKSFGGNSYFLREGAGNWLIDSPKYLPHLVRRFEEWGGVANIFLTHEDDVADAERYAGRFGARRFIHRAELPSQPGAEVVLDGDAVQELTDGFLAIPTPGHTEGHCALLVRDRYLFTGDHLSWDRHRRRLTASRSHCWHSWPQQVESLQRLTEHRFSWILPGHGKRVHLTANEMQRQLQRLLARL